MLFGVSVAAAYIRPMRSATPRDAASGAENTLSLLRPSPDACPVFHPCRTRP
ncbi:hypothetical protein STXM2123_2367 [Streptomyces sp. F-3]|nr:hypothetical protein STXM2123_2367 [Streptomyces sp. F-3]